MPHFHLHHSLWLLASLVLLPFMITGESIWIDEAQTATYAGMPTLEAFAGKISSDNRTGTLSEGLMPLSMFLALISGRILGISEWALRAPNLVYLAAGFFFIWRVGLVMRLPWLVLLFAVHPFVWYYADEARPYAFQIGVGCWLFWSVLKVIRCEGESRLGWFSYFTASLFLCGSSLLCVIPVAVTGFFLSGFLLIRKWRPDRFVIICAIGSMPLFLMLGWFYYQAIQNVAPGPKLWDFGWSNLAYAGYEALGFQGLGPSRNELRETAKAGGSLWMLIAPYMIQLSALFGLLVTAGVLCIRNPNAALGKAVIPASAIALACTLGFVLLGLIAKFPFWGRHLSPLLALIVFIVAALCAPAAKQLHGKLTVFLIAILWAWSSFNIRSDSRFANDDYRNAAAFAKKTASAGDQIWWAADIQGAKFYGLYPKVFEKEGITSAESAWAPTCHAIRNNSLRDLEALPQPRWIMLTKPDIYDSNGQIRAFLENGGYRIARRFTSFQAWTR